MRRLLAAGLMVSAVLAVGGLVGCGGGAEAGTSSTSVASAAAGRVFVARADAICRPLNVQIASVRVASTDLSGLARVLPRNVVLEERALARLEKLRVPPALASQWVQVLGLRRVLAADLGTLARDAARRDASAVRTVIAAKKLAHRELRIAAEAAGFGSCALVG